MGELWASAELVATSLGCWPCLHHPCFPTQHVHVHEKVDGRHRTKPHVCVCVCCIGVLQSCHAAAVVQEWAAVDFLRGNSSQLCWLLLWLHSFHLSCGLGTVWHSLHLPTGSIQVSACCHLCRHLLCAAAGAVPPKVKVSDVREQLQKQLDEVTPRCLNDD